MNTRRETDAAAAARFADAWEEFLLAVRRGQARLPQARGDLSLSQYYLLLPLAGGGELPASRLALEAGIAAPTATRVVDGLEKEGLVRRRRSSADRRSVLVSLTTSGRASLVRKRNQLARRRRRVYERLARAERSHAERLLRQLAELIGDL
jgi:DNA-binding MarR family transcriptional regulator